MADQSAEELKALGSAALAKMDYDNALLLYTKGLKSKQGLTPEVQTALQLNICLTYAKMNNHTKCIEVASQVLQKDPMNAKALFRRSKAYMAQEHFKEAALDAKALQRYYPQSPAGRDLIRELTLLLKDSETGCRKLLTDACKPDADVSLMKQLLGAVAEDEARAKECLPKQGIVQLMKAAKEKPLAWNVMSRISGYESCFPSVLSQCQSFQSTWFDDLVQVVQNESLSGIHSASVLVFLQRVAFRNLDNSAYLHHPVFTASLSDIREQVREVAIDACGQLYSQNRAASEYFVDKLLGVEKLAEVCKTDFQLAALCLSRILPVLTSVDKTKDDMVALHCEEFCALAFKFEGDWDPVKNGLQCVLALFHASNDVALEVCVHKVQILADYVTSAPDTVVSLVAEILAQLGNTERGRAVLGTLSAQLHMLIRHSNAQIRACASVALTKIEAVHFDSNTEQGALVLGSVGHLFRPEASWEEVSRGIEAVSFVIQDTDVKMMLTTGEEGQRVLKAICTRAKELTTKKKEEGLSNESAYGIAYLLQNLTMDEDDKKREKLREMEVSQEQWEQFEALTKQKSSTGNSRKDTPEEVAARIDAVIQCHGVSALKQLMTIKPSAAMAQAVSKAMVNLAGQPRVRGQMIAQGSISCLLKAHRQGQEEEKAHKSSEAYKGSPICVLSAHALARLLISTDPRLLPNEQVFDCLLPLVNQVKRCDEDLITFECCMALTNLETVSESVKDRIVGLGGVHAFEYAQFSDTPLVRRSATEAMSNLFPAQGLLDFLAFGDKVRLWILFAEDEESDLPTATAASGLLAQASAEPKIASRLRRFGASQRLARTVVDSLSGDLVWRLAVCLQMLTETEFEDTSKESENENKDGVVSNDGSWQVHEEKWTEVENLSVQVAMEHIIRFESKEPSWQNAKAVASAWLEEHGQK